MPATHGAETRTIAGGAPLARLLRMTEPAAPADAAPGCTWAFGPHDRASVVRSALADAQPGDRILVMGWIGTHPDATAPVLRALWELEEACRASRAPTLVLRLGPLIGRAAPLCAQLLQSDPPQRAGRVPMHPVAERDVVETLRRARAGAIEWRGWYELGGSEALTLAEVAAWLRAGDGTAPPEVPAAWEPGLDALLEQRLIEPDVWARWSGVEPRPVSEEIASWRA